ncbi:MAG: hypothetical protein FH748_13335 [Balneolaceae bacterium]|nr:hypothetical protein [Balneolaceae bacterium]
MTELDPSGSRFMFLRWDHLFFDFTSEGRVLGMWRIDAHRSALDILYYDESETPDYWQIFFDGKETMIWVKEKEGLRVMFNRLYAFPQ